MGASEPLTPPPLPHSTYPTPRGLGHQPHSSCFPPCIFFLPLPLPPPLPRAPDPLLAARAAPPADGGLPAGLRLPPQADAGRPDPHSPPTSAARNGPPPISQGPSPSCLVTIFGGFLGEILGVSQWPLHETPPPSPTLMSRNITFSRGGPRAGGGVRLSKTRQILFCGRKFRREKQYNLLRKSDFLLQYRHEAVRFFRNDQKNPETFLYKVSPQNFGPPNISLSLSLPLSLFVGC